MASQILSKFHLGSVTQVKPSVTGARGLRVWESLWSPLSAGDVEKLSPTESVTPDVRGGAGAQAPSALRCSWAAPATFRKDMVRQRGTKESCKEAKDSIFY